MEKFRKNCAGQWCNEEEEIVGHIALDWEQLGEWIRDGKITDGFTLAAYAKMSLQK